MTDAKNLVAVSQELKPCPFCGGEAYTEEHLLEETVSVHCLSCQAQMPYVGLDEQEAIAAWNTRLASAPSGEGEEADHAVSVLTHALERICETWEAANPIHTADLHRLDCPCMRCMIDMGRSALSIRGGKSG
jgi:Lar family restriction alleviation protein